MSPIGVAIMEARDLKHEIIEELMSRYAISQREAENRWNHYRQIDELGFIISQRRKGRE